MIELPEAATLADQVTSHLAGRTITDVEANRSPHKLTWFAGDPAEYPDLLAGAPITGATAHGGILSIGVGAHRLLLSDGANPRLLPSGDDLPAKHQLRLALDDGSNLVIVVAMYGGIQVFPADDIDYHYYRIAVAKPSPLTSAFDASYFAELLAAEATPSLSAKGFLATEQRIPGLGNGVLQDVLWNARVHPRRKVVTLSDGERGALHGSVVRTLRQMTDGGGRDTERDLFGQPGGYAAGLCRATLGQPCRRCSTPITKEAYLGGAVYFCPGCQKS